MAKSKNKTIYVCQSCGAQRSRWEGKCSECGGWNTLVEETFQEPKVSSSPLFKGVPAQKPVPLDKSIEEIASAERISTGVGELDRVLGGGLVPGSFVLLGGDPGIGKSTLILQMAAGLARKDESSVLYISAEESVAQTGRRAQRLGVRSAKVQIGSESNLETIIETARSMNPTVLVVDSIQTVFLPEVTSAPGSVSQVRECAAQLMILAKSLGVTVVIIGHVTKEGTLAGPRVLEHMVDCVLSFEGDRNHQFRLLRAVKNRFGATHELGVFQMIAEGLKEVTNPSELFLEERSGNAIGSAVFASMEGSRPLLCEVQALTNRSYLAMPRRTAVGFDINRVHLLTAVLSRHANVDLSHSDVFVNVVGGLKIEEPAADLAVAASLVSSWGNREIDSKTCYFGEIGLTGEIRAVSFAENRLREASHLGFQKFVIPYSNKKQLGDLDPKLMKQISWLRHVSDIHKILQTSPKQQREEFPARDDLDDVLGSGV